MSAPSGATAAQAEEQRAALVRSRRRATGLLAVVAVALLASAALPDTTATGYVRAMLEAGLVGGLADWFAVVALFRHPLGLPIPHTAVIPESKDGLGQNLATFVEDNFLSEDDIVDRLARREHVVALGGWLSRPDNAERIGGQVGRLALGVLDALDRQDLEARVTAAVHRRVLELPLPEVTGGALEGAVGDGRHVAAVSAAIDGVREALVDNRTTLRRRLGEQSPTWVPGLVDDIVFERAEEVVTTFLRQLAREEDHELRHALDDQLLGLTRRMQHDPEMVGRIDDAVATLVTPDLVAEWVHGWYDDLVERLTAVAEDPDDPARAAVGRATRDLGRRLAEDPALQDRVLDGVRDVAPTLAGIGQREISGLVEQTVDRWDPEETSERLELWLGPDLQFVRINGTVVGGVVGLVLHGVTGVLGF